MTGTKPTTGTGRAPSMGTRLKGQWAPIHVPSTCHHIHTSRHTRVMLAQHSPTPCDPSYEQDCGAVPEAVALRTSVGITAAPSPRDKGPRACGTSLIPQDTHSPPGNTSITPAHRYLHNPCTPFPWCLHLSLAPISYPCFPFPVPSSCSYLLPSTSPTPALCTLSPTPSRSLVPTSVPFSTSCLCPHLCHPPLSHLPTLSLVPIFSPWCSDPSPSSQSSPVPETCLYSCFLL